MKTNSKPNAEGTPTIEAFGVTYDVDVIAARIKEDLDAQAEELRIMGAADGRRWAAESATFEELSALEELRGEDVSFCGLCKRIESLADFVALGDEEASALRTSEMLAYAFGSGFVAGALQVWDVVQLRIEATPGGSE